MGHILSDPPDQEGFVVEGVALAGRAAHEELHDSSRFGWVMQAAIELRPAGRCRVLVRQGALLTEQPGERDSAQASSGPPQQLPATTPGRILPLHACSMTNRPTLHCLPQNSDVPARGSKDEGANGIGSAVDSSGIAQWFTCQGAVSLVDSSPARGLGENKAAIQA